MDANRHGKLRSQPHAWLPGWVPGLVCGLLLQGAARAQLPGQEGISAQSLSGQFTVYAGPMMSAAPHLANLATNAQFVQLDSLLLPASCERIKQSLWRELGVTTPWQGRVFLALHPAKTADETVTVISQPVPGNWWYRVELPDVVERVRYARAMVQVLLLELANRQAGQRSAEIPTWLVEGLTRQLMVADGEQLVLQPPRSVKGGITMSSTVVDARKSNPLRPAHQELSRRPPLTFEELSWPAPGQLAGEAGEVYDSSAQLFVNELLRLRDGRACLRTMVEELPQYYNWQFAFLHAFGAFFQRPLDVEKWWALQVVHFTGRDLGQGWTAGESWEKLDQTIRSSVQIRTGTNELPLHTEVSLQTIIRGWDRRSQTVALQGKLRELELLEPRLARELSALAGDYRKALETYLENSDKKGLVPFRRNSPQRRAVEEALQQLNALDARRKALQPVERALAARDESRRARAEGRVPKVESPAGN